MLFKLPHDQSQFEIPDAWWAASGAAGFVPSQPAYRAQPSIIKLSEELTSQSGETIQSLSCPTQVVALIYVAPPRRVKPFDEKSMIRVLRAMCSGEELPPIEAWRGVPGEGRFVPRNGLHRFYASVALGFPMLPVAVFRYVP
jgi:hypothetical protein